MKNLSPRPGFGRGMDFHFFLSMRARDAKSGGPRPCRRLHAAREGFDGGTARPAALGPLATVLR